MHIVAIHLGTKNTTAAFVSIDKSFCSVPLLKDLYIIDELTKVPTKLAKKENGELFIPVNNFDRGESNEDLCVSIGPIDSISEENRIILKSCISILYRNIFSNPAYHVCLDNPLVYLHIGEIELTIPQKLELEIFLREECGVPFVENVQSSIALLYHIRAHAWSGRIYNFDYNFYFSRYCIVYYLGSILQFFGVNNYNEITEKKVLSLGASLIDRFILDFLLSSNTKNREHLKMLKEKFSDQYIVSQLLNEINRWKYDIEEIRNQNVFYMPIIGLSHLFFDKSYIDCYIESLAESNETYDYYIQIISCYIVQLYDAIREFKIMLHNRISPSNVILMGRASRFRFFNERVKNTFDSCLSSYWYDEDSFLLGAAMYFFFFFERNIVK